MQQNKNTPSIRFAGFTDAWEQREFQEIAGRVSVMNNQNNLPRVEYEDIISGTGELNKDVFAKESSKSGILFSQGDVLYGKLRPYLKNWLLPNFHGIAVGDFWVLRPIDVDCTFMYRLIQSRQFEEVANQSTGTKMPRADWKLVATTTFLVPPSIAEQSKIGAFFSNLDDLITLHQRKCDQLVNIKKSMLEKMFPKNGETVPEVRFAGFTDAWEQREFQEIAGRVSVMNNQNNLPRVEYEDIISGTGELNKDVFAKESSKSGILFSQGDVLYGKLRPYLKNWLLPNFHGIAVGDFWVLRPIDVDCTFMYRLIQSRQFEEVANQSTGTKMPRADWKLVATTTFLVPPSIAEQSKIGAFFSNLDDLISLHQRKLERQQSIKKACLEKMFV